MRRALGMALALAAVPQAAQAAEWTRAIAPNGKFSAETICSPSELAALRTAPNTVIPDVMLMPESRLICMKDGALMVAGVLEEPNLPAGSKALFDLVSDQVLADKTAEGDPKLGTLGGHRSLYNRQEKDGTVALTGFVELSPTQIVMVIVGKDPKAAMTVAEQDAIITRFSQSIEVRGK
ncbi:hypothetical protein OKA06_13915 [Novosphingobium sp. MW5]|nr:hypothetical protein [Novosphingobium sp. MW5]